MSANSHDLRSHLLVFRGLGTVLYAAALQIVLSSKSEGRLLYDDSTFDLNKMDL